MRLKVKPDSRKKFQSPICNWKFVGLVLGVSVLIGSIGLIPLRLAMTLNRVPEPQAIFVLGGDYARFTFAASFWKTHSSLEMWVSDLPVSLEDSRKIFRQLEVPARKLHYDSCATDTVTNFTCLVEDFEARKIEHLYLITSEYHMRRARAIATLVLGSRGIVVTPVSVPSGAQPPDSWLRVVRDCFRSLLWIVTGRTAASFNPRLYS